MTKNEKQIQIWEVPSIVVTKTSVDDFILKHERLEGNYWDNAKINTLRSTNLSADIKSVELVPFNLPNDELVQVVKEMFSDRKIFAISLHYPSWRKFLTTEGVDRNPTQDEITKWINEQITNPTNIFYSIKLNSQIIGYRAIKKLTTIPEKLEIILPSERVLLSICLLDRFQAKGYGPIATSLALAFLFCHRDINSAIAFTHYNYNVPGKALHKISFTDITDKFTKEEMITLSGIAKEIKDTKLKALVKFNPTIAQLY